MREEVGVDLGVVRSPGFKSHQRRELERRRMTRPTKNHFRVSQIGRLSKLACWWRLGGISYVSEWIDAIFEEES